MALERSAAAQPSPLLEHMLDTRLVPGIVSVVLHVKSQFRACIQLNIQYLSCNNLYNNYLPAISRILFCVKHNNVYSNLIKLQLTTRNASLYIV